MPFKREGRKVLVQRNGKWVLFKQHLTEKKAEDHRIALVINVDVPAEERKEK